MGRIIKFIFLAIGSFLILWQFFPSVILAPYNSMTHFPVTANGQYILDENDPEYIEGSSDIKFKHVEIDPVFHSEGASVADINKDGLNDIVTGHFWYEAPNWTRHVICAPLKNSINIPKLSDHIRIYFADDDGSENPLEFFLGSKKDIWSEAYPLAFFSFHEDVNNDGWVDVIALDITTRGFYWFENPQNVEGPWKEHFVLDFTRNESPVFGDVLGTGTKQVITGASPSRNETGNLFAVDFPLDGSFKIHPIGAEVEGRNNGASLLSHGLGFGDVNSDGLQDIIYGSGDGFINKDGVEEDVQQMYPEGGWFEQQISQTGERSWKWHLIDPFVAMAQIQVVDVNEDGKNDLISGAAHDVGLFWFEQGDNVDQWIPHVIDDSYTQIHATEMADIDGDGELDIVAGKTPLAHFGLKDIDEYGTPYIYWYKKIKNENGDVRFERHFVSDNAGVGRQFTVHDIDKDGLLDIAVGSREGIHLYLQQK
ncbi:MAG: VCBS repeat-containing protein [Kordiimonadaceae bacterium]|jgi:hypothetical protein|nr:VCBS repeat-containing protein [Kordiimonadaceae bacterium]MBT6031216.1 VCBS repeat-containing protein [Kordiimonadaceae bacterium]